MDYLCQIKKMLNDFTQAEVSKLIGVSERSIQFYLQENPKVPHQKTKRTIHEVYNKLYIQMKPYKQVLAEMESRPIQTEVEDEELEEAPVTPPPAGPPTSGHGEADLLNMYRQQMEVQRLLLEKIEGLRASFDRLAQVVEGQTQKEKTAVSPFEQLPLGKKKTEGEVPDQNSKKGNVYEIDK